MDEIDEAAQILRDARNRGQMIYVNACLKYIMKMNPCEDGNNA